MLSRVDFAKVFDAKAYQAQSSQNPFFKGSARTIDMLTHLLHATYSRDGFMDMMFLDPSGYDLQHYNFAFVRRQFLGNVRTAVFDVSPKPDAGSGRFLGRIWIEDQNGNIVRFNGTYSRGEFERADHYWIHFDSWRTNLQPGLWLPTAIYAEEDSQPDAMKSQGFRAQTYFWGYSLGLPPSQSDNESIRIDNVVDQSQATQDVSPLEAQRDWDAQAEQNVVDRLTTAGLVAPPSPFDKVLDQVTDNLIIGNKLTLSGDVHCRVLLTTPLESVSIGNTILISKGLIDVLPTESDLAAVLSFQLAQIALGHQVNTKYAFEDRLLFPDEATFQRLQLNHSEQDDAASAKEAIKLLDNSVYRNQLASVGLFLAELQAKEKYLKALLTPNLGDPVISPNGSPWLAGVSKEPARLQPDNVSQIAALPLGSHITVDPWDDAVSDLHAPADPILSARDKMPLEITPIYFRLHRYETAEASPGAPAAGAAPAANPATPAASSAPGATNAPAAAQPQTPAPQTPGPQTPARP